MFEKGRTKLALLAAVSIVLGLSAVAPAFAWYCGTENLSGTNNPAGIVFTQTSSAGSPIIITTVTTVFGPSGNTISYWGFSGQYMYVYITGVTAGWTVTVTSSPSSLTTATLASGIIVGPLSGASSFKYIITVKAPSTPGASGQFTINAEPDTSSTSASGVGGVACTAVTVYLQTAIKGYPPSSVPQFPLGMALLLLIAIPGLLLVKSKYTRKYSSTPV